MILEPICQHWVEELEDEAGAEVAKHDQRDEKVAKAALLACDTMPSNKVTHEFPEQKEGNTPCDFNQEIDDACN